MSRRIAILGRYLAVGLLEFGELVLRPVTIAETKSGGLPIEPVGDNKL